MKQEQQHKPRAALHVAETGTARAIHAGALGDCGAARSKIRPAENRQAPRSLVHLTSDALWHLFMVENLLSMLNAETFSFSPSSFQEIVRAARQPFFLLASLSSCLPMAFPRLSVAGGTATAFQRTSSPQLWSDLSKPVPVNVLQVSLHKIRRQRRRR